MIATEVRILIQGETAGTFFRSHHSKTCCHCSCSGQALHIFCHLVVDYLSGIGPGRTPCVLWRLHWNFVGEYPFAIHVNSCKNSVLRTSHTTCRSTSMAMQYLGVTEMDGSLRRWSMILGGQKVCLELRQRG